MRDASRSRTAGLSGDRLALLIRILLVGGFVSFWEFAVRMKWWNRGDVSAPTLIAGKISGWIFSGYLWPHLSRTLQEVVIGFALGLIVATITGFALGRNRLLGAIFEPILGALNAVPRIVLAPLLILWFGIGIASKVALSFLMVFFVVIFAVMNGIREVDRALVHNALIMGATPRQLDRYVYLPAALTWIFGSLRLAIGFAFTAAIVGEFLLSSRGLGYLLNAAQNSFDSTGMMAGLAVLMVIIGALNAVAARIERKASLWKTARNK